MRASTAPIALLVAVGCAHAPALSPDDARALRLEARELAEDDPREAARTDRRAANAGDPLAALEGALILAEGDPTWSETASDADRARWAADVGRLEELDTSVTLLRIAPAVLFVGGLAAVTVGAVQRGGEEAPAEGLRESDVSLLTGAGVGASGLLLFVASAITEAVLGSERSAFRERVRSAVGATSARIDLGAGTLAIHF